ncbi:metal-dependent phosphohydrolase [Oscillatoria sp. CS-180]|uniref:metal-dependent phosphohydrolase n=1 Tax=Oscillatoria sp. CS-180 TaxID=3021720 RepID=UPI00232B6F8F|nr:metal-dependent phosphohydrolase [Oscillatoria sp. CS-180]MDB9525861.1 metal-dependent phosphohydrolase [Oscillatoria sp. CS-180]
MLDFKAKLVWLSNRYQALFGQFCPRYDDFLIEIATPVMRTLAAGDAPYHTVDHTLQVIEVGQLILEGKQRRDGTLSPHDWLQFMAALVCHDVGYVKAVLEQDEGDRHRYADGKGGWTVIAPTATGAALADSHVDRGKVYVSSSFQQNSLLDIGKIQHYIEMTRFPIPHEELYQDTAHYGGLCRAADLMGQLSDANYLKKLPALFREFEETDMNRSLGYQSPEELRAGYPRFFWQVVYPYIQASIYYCGATAEGRKVITRLYSNLCLAEIDQPPCDATDSHLQNLEDASALRPWQEAGFTFL